MKLILIACLALLQTAQAYVPPSFFIIRMLGHKHANIENGRFRSKVTFYRKGGDPVTTVSETLLLNDSDRASIRLTDASGNELATTNRKLLGGRSNDLDRPVPYDLLFVHDGTSIYEHLKTLGLPLRTESALYAEKEGTLPYKPEEAVTLQRMEHGTAVVVGNIKPDMKNDQSTSLWVEKESYLPLRAVFPSSPESGMASEALDFRMSGYQAYRNFLYPKTMQIYRNGALWAKVEVQDVRPGRARSV